MLIMHLINTLALALLAMIAADDLKGCADK